MAVFKCKMCGGNLDIEQGVTVYECEYCGTKQTVPSCDDEKKLTLFTRANRLRFNCEFDKAAGVYESIVADFPEEAEAYWGLVLCKYGIEYVDDPATAKKIPTCHRSSFESVMDDSNFEMALEYADAVARPVYREEAKAIEEIRKGIIEVSSKEEPYDIFICYKETAENGDRTLDSVIAQDVYTELTDKGYRVFFSRITLEDKLGREYEPYIFAALNSAKVMLAFGTDYEYYNAVWVKNEWSRFLQLIAAGEKKTLIPCYKGIDAYDMPKEFARLQAQDMGKVGAIQDLVRGIEKIIPKTPNETVVKETVVAGADVSVDSLLKKVQIETLLNGVQISLSDANWNFANEYCKKVLDIDPENAEAYLGKLMVELRVEKREELKNLAEPFDQYENYKKAISFGDEALKTELTGYVEFIKDNIYNNAKSAMNQANSKYSYLNVAKAFDLIEDYLDSKELASECREKADEARQKVIRKIKKVKVIAISVSSVVAVITAFIILLNSVIIPNIKYNKAIQLANEGKYIEAIMAFNAIDGYKDSKEKSFELWNNIANRDTVSAGENHTVGLRADGTVVAIGINEYGQCDVSGWKDIVAISAGENYTVGLKADGTVVVAGYNSSQYDVSSWKDIVSVSVSKYQIVGLKADGTVVAVGNLKNLLNVSDWKDIVAISAGNFQTVGLKSDGTVVAGGMNVFGECNVSEWTDIVTISAGKNHIVGLKSDGTVVAVGNNNNGQCNVSDWTGIVAISAGGNHTIGLKADGTVVAVGEKDGGQCNVSDWKDIVAVSAGSNFTVGLKADGTVVAVGRNKEGQCDVSDWKNIKLPKKK